MSEGLISLEQLFVCEQELIYELGLSIVFVLVTLIIKIVCIYMYDLVCDLLQ